MATEVYPNGPEDKEVRDYLDAFFGKSYTRMRNGKEQKVSSRPQVNPGRVLLNRVLQDGAWTIQRVGAGKIREDVLNDSCDVWDKSKRFYRWGMEHYKIDLDNVLDCDEFCIFCCGHIILRSARKVLHLCSCSAEQVKVLVFLRRARKIYATQKKMCVVMLFSMI